MVADDLVVLEMDVFCRPNGDGEGARVPDDIVSDDHLLCWASSDRQETARDLVLVVAVDTGPDEEGRRLAVRRVASVDQVVADQAV